MKRVVIIFFTVAISVSIYSQTISDALRFTQTFYGSTARFSGLGGAYGALGGDFSSLSLNPAGIGVYRASEFTFTPYFVNNASSASFNGRNGNDFVNNYNLGNLGFVHTYNSRRESGWVSTSFGLGYNNTNDFNKNIIINSGNSSNSVIDVFLNRANNDGFTPDALAPLTQGLAYDAYLIDTAGGQYIKYNTSTNMRQMKTIQSSGSSGAFIFSFGANYSNKLYLGATVEINRYYYSENAIYFEQNMQTPYNSSNPLESFNYNQNFRTYGSGVTLKLGAIYKPIELLRIGLAVHFPTFYSLHDDVDYSIEPFYFNDGTGKAYAGNVNSYYSNGYDYSFTTPLKAIGSIALRLGHAAILSADYEYVDYSNMKFSQSDYTDQNTQIQNSLKSTGNIRTGAEIKLGTLAIRGGYDLYGNPYKSSLSSTYSFDNYSVSGGFGLREKNFFIDAAYVYSVEKDKSAEMMYVGDGSPTITTTGNKYLLTVGFRF